MGAVVLAVALAGAAAAAQPPGSRLPDPGSRVAVDPIRCWRQASSGAVTIGESFRVTLTCAVFESGDAQVIADESRLSVASIQMAPFEIVGGAHPPDVRRGSRRFFQYDYDVRIISRDAIGRDVSVPALTISYRIHSQVGAAAKLEGRDLSYLLPALPIRVLSLVPADATDIRDGAEASLAAVDSLRSRSRLFEIVALSLGALAVATALFALLPMARRAGAADTPDRNLIPDRAILAGASASLRDTQRRAAAEGWTDDLIGSALAVIRLVAAAAIGHHISRKPIAGAGAVPDGRLRVDHGLLRRAATAVSSPVTAQDVARAAAQDGNASRAHQLDGLRSGLALLTAAMYRRGAERDGAAIDAAVTHAIAAAGGLASDRSWLKSRWARR